MAVINSRAEYVSGLKVERKKHYSLLQVMRKCQVGDTGTRLLPGNFSNVSSMASFTQQISAIIQQISFEALLSSRYWDITAKKARKVTALIEHTSWYGKRKTKHI